MNQNQTPNANIYAVNLICSSCSLIFRGDIYCEHSTCETFEIKLDDILWFNMTNMQTSFCLNVWNKMRRHYGQLVFLEHSSVLMFYYCYCCCNNMKKFFLHPENCSLYYNMIYVPVVDSLLWRINSFRKISHDVFSIFLDTC